MSWKNIIKQGEDLDDLENKVKNIKSVGAEIKEGYIILTINLEEGKIELQLAPEDFTFDDSNRVGFRFPQEFMYFR